MDCRQRRWPLWVLAAPLLLVGIPPSVTPDDWFLVGQLGIVGLFDRYELSLFGSLLPQIREEIDIPEERIGIYAAVIRIGAFAAFIFGVLADKYGRRKVLGVTIVGYTVCSGLTAYSRSAAYFVTVQCLARFFAEAELMVGYVMLCESFPAAIRGWGVGALQTLVYMGHGPAILGVALVDRLPFGWRSLYMFGIVPLTIAAWLRRTLKEPAIYVKHAAQQANERIWSRRSISLIASTPMLDAFRMYPKRMTLALLIEAIFSLNTAAGFYQTAYYEEVGRFSPRQFGSMALSVGMTTQVAGPLMGRACDRWGRRRVGCVCYAGSALTHWGTYQLTDQRALAAMFAAHLIIFIGVHVAKDSLLTEVFPTSYRTTAASLRTVTKTITASAALLVEAVLYKYVGSNYRAASLMSLFALSGAPLFLLMPESAGRELDDVSPELRAAAPKTLGRRVQRSDGAADGDVGERAPFVDPLAGSVDHGGGDDARVGDSSEADQPAPTDGPGATRGNDGPPPPHPPSARGTVSGRLQRARKGMFAFFRPGSMH